ncbi:MAG: glycerophosphodiester phosphodiesterase [Actinobacteria bacterium]|nr:glycerophosphodiester phosphodiesterase [Actinomycetota bacterium]MCI0679041.1 glycerophosphodiester phosphodiesterase [Actinomycetota bacterium]
MINWSAPVAIAHRGSRYHWPENTLEAFAGAVSMGYRHIETDVRMTRDGVLVCIHDPTVDRTTEGVGRVAEFDFADLESLDAGHRHSKSNEYPFRGRKIRVPRLEETVASFPDTRFVLDLKADGMAMELARIIDDQDLGERVVVGSFNDRRLREVRRATSGRVPVSTGSARSRSWVAASRMGRSPVGAASALQVPKSLRGVRVVDGKLVAAAHRAGLQVHVWTVNEREEMGRLLDLGVDGLVTDRLDVLREVLAGRGAWES